jgi:hypothetical protein
MADKSSNKGQPQLARIAGATRQIFPTQNPVPLETTMAVDTAGGRIHVSWDESGKMTGLGQLPFFAEFLEFAQLFERWVQTCPLHYQSNNAPALRDVLGTWMLSVLEGHRRYAHVGSLRGDGVAPKVLDMGKIIGDESLRRALAKIAPAANAKHSEEQRLRQISQLADAEKWMGDSLLDSVKDALIIPWILDVDTTIKTLYGHQDGAEVGYNAHKPGRPSHAIHTFWLGSLRLVLQAIVQGGKESSSAHTLPGLIELLLKLSPEQRPKLVRADCGFGNEKVLSGLEGLDQDYLIKLKQTANVKAKLKEVMSHFRETTWCDAGQGWDATESTLKLLGWDHARRVILLRRVIKDVEPESSNSGSKAKGKKKAKPKSTAGATPQMCLQLPDANPPILNWEYAVLVTNSDMPVESMGQMYRDRADCENGFDELKNQWGWGGYSTRDIERCNLSARAVALIHNWWSWYCRLAHPKARLEAITSRPLLLGAVGKSIEHAGQHRMFVSILTGAADRVKALTANIRAGLRHIRATAPQLKVGERWKALVAYIVGKILAELQKDAIHLPAPPILSLG